MFSISESFHPASVTEGHAFEVLNEFRGRIALPQMKSRKGLEVQHP